MTATEVGFLKPLETAVALCDSFPLIVVKTADDYAEAEKKRKQAREFMAELDRQYKEHPIVIQAKEIQKQKLDLEKRLEKFNKDVKAIPMKKFEDEQEAIRLKEEARLAEIARKEQAAETARLVAEQKAIAAQAEKDRKAAAKRGDDAAAAEAAAAAASAKAEAEAIKSAPVFTPTVVVERTAPQVSRRKVFKWRLTAKDGRKFLKGEMRPGDRLKIADLGAVPAFLFTLDPVLLNEFVDQQGESAAIPGVLEVKAEMV